MGIQDKVIQVMLLVSVSCNYIVYEFHELICLEQTFSLSSCRAFNAACALFLSFFGTRFSLILVAVCWWLSTSYSHRGNSYLGPSVFENQLLVYTHDQLRKDT